MRKGEALLGPGWSDEPDSVGFKPLEVPDQAGATPPAPPPPGKLAGVPPHEQVLRLLGGSGHHHPAPVSPHCHKAGARGWAGFIVSEDIPYQGSSSAFACSLTCRHCSGTQSPVWEHPGTAAAGAHTCRWSPPLPPAAPSSLAPAPSPPGTCIITSHSS